MALLETISLRQSSMHALHAGKAVAQEEADRVCDDPGCSTRLSRYNPAPSCCRHEGWAEEKRARRRA